LVTQLDQLWNRFSPSSIIFKVNHSSLPLLVDEDTFQVLEAAQEGREKTQGFFNILITPPDFDTFC
jgi:thiamine biosynthesis lipoprotein ApbE